MSNRGKHWPNLHHVAGPATDLPPLLDAAASSDATEQDAAIAQLRSLLVAQRDWCSAAPRAVAELLAAAFDPSTNRPGPIFVLVADIVMAGPWKEPKWDALGEEVRAVVTEREDDLMPFARHRDPLARAGVTQLLWVTGLDLPSGPDADPLVDASLAIARARRGLDVWAGPTGTTLASLFDEPDFDGLVTLLAETPFETDRFRWGGGHLHHVVDFALSKKPDLAARILAAGFARHTEHPDRSTWVTYAGSLAFPGSEPDSLNDTQTEILRMVFDAPYPRGSLDVAWVPADRADGRRWIGLDPPGPWEQKMGDTPFWLVMEGATEEMQKWMELPVSDQERLELAGDTAFRPYWLEPVSPGILAVLAGRADALEWAKSFLGAIPHRARELDEDPETWHHTQFARATLAKHGVTVEATPAPAPVAAPAPPAPSAPPESPPEPDPAPAPPAPSVAVDAGRPHIATDADPVIAVLTALRAVLALPDHTRDVQQVVRTGVQWARTRNAVATDAWRMGLSDRESHRLSIAEDG